MSAAKKQNGSRGNVRNPSAGGGIVRMQTSKRARPSDQKVLPYLTSAEDSILDAAERLFAKHGYDGVSNKQLAAEAGLTIGAIYHYFSSKDEVYAAAIRRRFANKAPLPTEIRESTEPAKRRLSRLITWFVASIFFDRHIGLLLQRELLNPRFGVKSLIDSGAFKDAFDLFQELLRELLPKVDIDEALAVTIAVVFGFSNLKGISTIAPRVRTIVATPDEIGIYATNLILKGMRR